MFEQLSTLKDADSDPASAPFAVAYVPTDQVVDILPSSKLLAAIHFSEQTRTNPDDPRQLELGLPQLNKETSYTEIWTSNQSTTNGWDGPVGYSVSDELMFAHILIDDAQYPDISDATNYAYVTLLNFIKQKKYPHLLRIWNYFPDINGKATDMERYKAFCAGRYDAFNKDPDFEQKLPAATAIGTHTNGLMIYLIAAKTSGVQIENPRQVSAFQYPEQYGKKRPSFSRGTLKTWGDAKHFYLSGTASVVGHESCHKQNCLEQLKETLKNIQALMRHCAAQHGALMEPDKYILDMIKVYIRHAEDYEDVKRYIENELNELTPTLYLRGDICRSDLIIEIDGLLLGKN